MIYVALFWISFSLIVYHLFLYAPLLWLINLFQKKNNHSVYKIETANLPTIIVLCPAYNEEADIEDKIKSFLALDYPADKIKMIVISDDSTDNTNSIVQKYECSNLELIIQKPRGGKQRAHNIVQPSITSDYILSTDANSIFEPDAVIRLVEAISQNPQIGIVSGELKLIKAGDKDSGEGLYWKYETFLKRMDSAFSSIVGSNGSIYLIRRELFSLIHPQAIDDFERTLSVLSKGYKAVYVPEAIVKEKVTEHAQEEIKRKVRIIAREWAALKRNIVLLNPFRFCRISFVLISHKIIRWLFFLFVLLILISCIMLPYPFYQWLLKLQILFYLIGVLELIAQNAGKHIPGTGLIAYFTAMVWASLLAFIKFIFSVNTGVWNPVRKQGT
jgi:biofilm PGA synthesis N-glycosyltransferase PgaC